MTDQDAIDEVAQERRNVTRLLRVMSGFVAWPAFTGGLAFLVITGPTDHWLHIYGLLAAGVLAVAVYLSAPRLAIRFVRTA